MQKKPPGRSSQQRRYSVRVPRELADEWDALVRDERRRTGLTNIGGSLLLRAMKALLVRWGKRGRTDGLDGDGHGRDGDKDGNNGRSSKNGEPDDEN